MPTPPNAQRLLLPAATVGAALALAACAPRAARDPGPAETLASPAPSPSPIDEVTVFVGPETAPPPGLSTGEDAPEPPAPGPATSALWRPDGRPTWWLSAPLRQAGRVAVTAEALEDSVVDARRAAVDAGSAALRRLLVGEPREERTEALIVRRLPGDAPGRHRYVGYIRVSAAE